MSIKKTKKVEVKSPEKVEVKNYIYIGPNWSQKGIITNKLYKKELGALEKELIKEYPEFGSLFVETKDISKADKVKVKGSLEYIAYNRALKIARGGK